MHCIIVNECHPFALYHNYHQRLAPIRTILSLMNGTHSHCIRKLTDAANKQLIFFTQSWEQHVTRPGGGLRLQSGRGRHVSAVATRHSRCFWPAPSDRSRPDDDCRLRSGLVRQDSSVKGIGSGTPIAIPSSPPPDSHMARWYTSATVRLLPACKRGRRIRPRCCSTYSDAVRPPGGRKYRRPGQRLPFELAVSRFCFAFTENSSQTTLNPRRKFAEIWTAFFARLSPYLPFPELRCNARFNLLLPQISEFLWKFNHFQVLKNLRKQRYQAAIQAIKIQKTQMGYLFIVRQHSPILLADDLPAMHQMFWLLLKLTLNHCMRINDSQSLRINDSQSLTLESGFYVVHFRKLTIGRMKSFSILRRLTIIILL